MITIFNRIALCVTRSLKEQGDVRFTLGSNKIQYKVKTVDKNDPTKWRVKQQKDPFGAPKRDAAYEYIIYIDKKDYVKARKLLAKSTVIKVSK